MTILFKIESLLLAPMVGNTRMSERSAEEIKNEPMLFNCEMAAANQLGGPITKEFLRMIPLDWHEEPLVIDTRVHMLMKGWYPCIPGWHHDDVPRTRLDGQPQYRQGQDRSVHCMVLVNGNICPTEFALGTELFPEVCGGTVYKDWHKRVQFLLHIKKLSRWQIPDRTVTMFSDRTWHRGTPAVEAGWRWFGRVSRYFDKHGNCIPRRNERTNEVRRQVQVYMEDPNLGW